MNSIKIEAKDYFLPCPFCGESEVEIIESEFEDHQEGEGLTVYCDCGAHFVPLPELRMKQSQSGTAAARS